MAFAKAIQSNNETSIAQDLEKAANLNSFEPRYKVVLSRFYLNLVASELAKPAAEQDQTKIQDMASKAIEQGRLATEISPNSAVTWENRGIIYREFISLAAGAAEFSKKSFESAIALDPKNPALYTELGGILLAENIDGAKIEFDRALELKSNYAPAMLQLAFLDERAGNQQEA